MKFKDLEQDDQFTLPGEITLAPGVVLQKQSDNEAVLVDELMISPDDEVEKL